MVTSARFDEIKDYFEPLNALPTLILPQAFLLVQHGFEEMNLASMKYPSVFSSLIRTSAREVLEKEPLEDWLLDTHTDRLHLIHKSGIRVRFLKKLNMAMACLRQGITLQGSQTGFNHLSRGKRIYSATPSEIYVSLLAGSTMNRLSHALFFTQSVPAPFNKAPKLI